MPPSSANTSGVSLPPHINISVRSVSKRFASTWVLRNISYEFASGVVYGLVGVNGSGKSTLMQIMAGVDRPSKGEVVVSGDLTADESHRLRVGFVPQELPMVPDLSVAENIYLGNWPRKLGVLQHRKLLRDARSALQRVGLELDVTQMASNLTVGEQQLVVIARVLVQEPDVLLLDEPTSALAVAEADHLFDIVRNIAGEGKTVVIVSQRLDDITAVGQQLLVLREGELIASGPVASYSPRQVVALMLYGVKEPQEKVESSPAATATKKAMDETVSALVLDNFVASGLERGTSIRVPPGQILGVVGLRGSGTSALLRGLFGLSDASARRFSLFGHTLNLATPRVNVQRGIAYVTGDRRREGLVLSATVADNLAMAMNRRLLSGPWRLNRARRAAIAQISKLKVHPPDPDALIAHLSGGNQQKVIFARWSLIRPQLWLLDDPTRGVDIAAREDIHKAIKESTRNAQSVALMASSDNSELFEVCDRLLVFWRGAVVADLMVGDTTLSAVEALTVGASEGVNA